MANKYDFLIVGSGFFGAICAYELQRAGHSVLVIDKRNHIGGNCYTSTRDGINIHDYGPHIFHTSNKEVWDWINQFTTFNNFINSPLANFKDELYSLPFNMYTFNKMWGVTEPEQAKQIIESQKLDIENPKNLEEQALKTVGRDIYFKLIKGYTEKQWRKPANQLPKEIIKRLPIRFTYNNNYFTDKFQGIPEGGYTPIFNKLLNNVEVKLQYDFFKNNLPSYSKLIYTGPIDKFFNYKYGKLEYKTVKLEHYYLPDVDNYQGNAVVNYTEREIPHTRIIEHKHFELLDNKGTWLSKEYPVEYIADKTDPYYPVNDKENTEKYIKYKKEADKLTDVYFGGRLAEYKYYDMHQVIESALKFVRYLY